MSTQKAQVPGRGAYTARRWFGVLVVVSAALGCASNAANGGSTGGSSGSSSSSGGMTSGGVTSAGSGGAVADTGGTAAGGATAGAAATDGGVTSGGAPNAGGATDTGGTTSSGGATDTGGTTSSGGTSMSGGGTGTAGSGGAFTGPTYPYIFSNFNDAASLSSLMIYTSNDALNWTLLYDTKFTGPTGFMRDPSIMRHTDGKYYIAFTTPPTLSCCGDESSFAVASSANLKDWTTVATVPNGVSGVKNTWAPEWFIDSDGTVHVTVTLDLRTYRYEPTDSTLSKWGSGTFIGLNGTIDTQIIKIGTTYHAIIPNRHGTSASLDGPWTFGSDYKAPPTCKEAPAVVHISGNTWRFYCDDGGSGHEKSSLTTDLFQTWSSLQTLPVVGDNISHGTVIRGDTGHPF